MWRGKTAGMLAAFQGFSTPHDGKKQGKMYKLFIDSSLSWFWLGVKYIKTN